MSEGSWKIAVAFPLSCLLVIVALHFLRDLRSQPMIGVLIRLTAALTVAWFIFVNMNLPT